MPWIQTKIASDPNHASTFEDLMMAIGAQAVTLQDGGDQPIFEPVRGTTPLWEHTLVIALFDSSVDLHKRMEQLKSSYESQTGVSFPSFKIEQVEDKDWEREWMDNFHPIQFGETLWVCPSWRDIPDPNAVNLMLDPGLAFGTGTHPTTALCLEWLEAQSREGTLKGKNIIDFGCGSGILGIAGLLLGCDYMFGIDIDPQALTATADNAGRNNIQSSKFDVYLPDQAPEYTSNLLVANILAGPLIDLAPIIAARVNSGGSFALSGILEHQASEVVSAYENWFDLDPIAVKDEWVRISGIKK